MRRSNGRRWRITSENCEFHTWRSPLKKEATSPRRPIPDSLVAAGCYCCVTSSGIRLVETTRRLRHFQFPTAPAMAQATRLKKLNVEYAL